jgi:hypothetical protein
MGKMKNLNFHIRIQSSTYLEQIHVFIVLYGNKIDAKN